MKRVLESRLTPAIVVGLVGVIVVAGIAIAGPAISAKKKKKGLTAAKVSAIADQRIAAAAPNLSVKSAGTAGSAGDAGTAGSLRMFGHVSDTGVLSDASGIGFATFSPGGGPVYCLGGLAAAPRGGEVTADSNEAGIRDFPQLGLGPASGCPAGTQAFVTISNVGTGSFTDSGFFIEFWS